MNIADINSLKEDCGFINVSSHPTGDNYGAMTIVQLTDEQTRIWKQLDAHEIKRHVLQSESFVRMRLMQPYFVKSPKIRTDGRNTIYFYGSQLVAVVFFRGIFPKENPN